MRAARVLYIWQLLLSKVIIIDLPKVLLSYRRVNYSDKRNVNNEININNYIQEGYVQLVSTVPRGPPPHYPARRVSTVPEQAPQPSLSHVQLGSTVLRAPAARRVRATVYD